MEIAKLPLEGIRINGGTQPRVETNEAAIADYAESIRAGAELPPVIVFDDGTDLWLADGFHRFHAHRTAGTAEIQCDVRRGTRRDAVLFSVGANASHGLRRSNEDKRKAVMTLLNDTEWSTWSGNQIAKACSVSESFVRHLRLNEDAPAPAVRTVERSGQTYQQNTANIGKKSLYRQAEPAAAAIADNQPELPSEESAQNAEIEAVTPAAGPKSSEYYLEHPDALKEQLVEVAEALKSALADNEMMGRVFDADDRIKAAMDEAMRQKAIAENAERTLAAKNGEYIERARAVTHWQNRALKAEKALAKLKEAA